jgi:hypothetical protein
MLDTRPHDVPVDSCAIGDRRCVPAKGGSASTPRDTAMTPRDPERDDGERASPGTAEPHFSDASRRTYLSQERTLLAWWRTTLGTISGSGGRRLAPTRTGRPSRGAVAGTRSGIRCLEPLLRAAGRIPPVGGRRSAFPTSIPRAEPGHGHRPHRVPDGTAGSDRLGDVAGTRLAGRHNLRSKPHSRRLGPIQLQHGYERCPARFHRSA